VFPQSGNDRHPLARQYRSLNHEIRRAGPGLAAGAPPRRPGLDGAPARPLPSARTRRLERPLSARPPARPPARPVIRRRGGPPPGSANLDLREFLRFARTDPARWRRLVGLQVRLKPDGPDAEVVDVQVDRSRLRLRLRPAGGGPVEVVDGQDRLLERVEVLAWPAALAAELRAGLLALGAARDEDDDPMPLLDEEPGDGRGRRGVDGGAEAPGEEAGEDAEEGSSGYGDAADGEEREEAEWEEEG